jgi:hypothetical protein
MVWGEYGMYCKASRFGSFSQPYIVDQGIYAYIQATSG